MKRPVLLAFVSSVAVFLALAALSPVLGDSLRRGIFSPVRLALDGRSFREEGSGTDDLTLVKREFGKFGVDFSGDFGTQENGTDSRSIFSGHLVEEAEPGSRDSHPLPGGLTAEHNLRMESGTGSIDLVLGKLERRGASMRNRLIAEGWILSSSVEDTGPVRVLEKTTGKERAIVCLDEAEGGFLLLREGGR